MTRYADDFVICCRSRRGAERVLKQVTKLLEEELGLKVHPDKTKIVNHEEESFDFLGHVFKPGRVMKPSTKSMKKFKERIKGITRRNQTVNMEAFIKKFLNAYLRGWKKDLPSIRMTAWRNSSCQHAHYAMPNSWFKEIGLCSLLDMYNEHHPQRG